MALLASGLSSSSVGTYAGQVVMQGFIRRQIPLFVRRAVTMAPALVVLGLGLPATDSLVISQVVLSFGIPFALVPLLLLTRRRDIMGTFVNNRLTNLAAATDRGADHRAERVPALRHVPRLRRRSHGGGPASMASPATVTPALTRAGTPGCARSTSGSGPGRSRAPRRSGRPAGRRR